jgi:hypothetical protein
MAGGDYDKLLAEERLKNELARKENPLTYVGSELGGGIATSFIPGVGLAKGASLARNIGAAAGMGALSGAGYSDGDLEDRAKGAGMGAGVGGALGGMGALASKGLQRLSPRLAEVATGATGKELSTKFKPGSGEALLEKGIVGWTTTPAKIAEKAEKQLAGHSAEIGNSLGKIDQISKDQIMANLFTERAKLSGNEANRKAISLLDKEIAEFAKSPKMRDAQDIWNVKKAFEGKVNWLTRQTKPGITQANEKVAGALRSAVADVAESQSPDLARKFAQERQAFSLLAPIKEAAEREAATLNQRKIGGMLDTAAGAGGTAASLLSGRGTLESLAAGGAAALARRAVTPRLPSFLAKLTGSQAAQQTALRAPVSIYQNIMNKGKK